MQRQNELDLTGKVVIITGASRGVGKQNALDFAKAGAKVVLAARTVAANSKLPGTIGETLAAVEALGGEALAVATDLAVEADLERLVEATVARFGGVDVLVNNAAMTAGSAWAFFREAISPARSALPSPFTGGLFMVMTAMPSRTA